MRSRRSSARSKQESIWLAVGNYPDRRIVCCDYAWNAVGRSRRGAVVDDAGADEAWYGWGARGAAQLRGKRSHVKTLIRQLQNAILISSTNSVPLYLGVKDEMDYGIFCGQSEGTVDLGRTK